MRWLRSTPELRIAIGVSWLLVIARSLVFALYEHAHFDSDQAIVGLMAKHLSEGRAFPLFFYGQSYLLAVEAWLAVPFFWIAGATVGALRASIILTNLAVATLLIIGLHRAGVRPYGALIASFFIVLPPPNTTAYLVEAQGGNIEPFFWILLLWFVRDRPFWFGSILAVGFLNREFVAYAVPVLLLGQAWSRTLFTRGALRSWLFVAVAFAAVWQGIRALEPLSDAMGPGTRGSVATATRGSQIENLAQRVQVDLRGFPVRVGTVTRDDIAALLGGRFLTEEVAPQGRTWMGYLLAIFVVAGVARTGMVFARGRQVTGATSFAAYVLGIGMVAVLTYAATRPAEDVVRRYLLLSLMIPVGLTALWLTLEPRRVVRQFVVAAVIGWAALSGIDNWNQFNRYRSGVANPMRELATALEARGVSTAEAPYWRAYKLTFLTGERIRVASVDVVRIKEYQDVPAQVRVQESPCDRGQKVGDFYICPTR